MSENQPIHRHEPYADAGEHQHIGMHAHRKALLSVTEKIREWRMERTSAHEQGHRASGIDEIPQDQEIVLFFPEPPQNAS